MYDGIVADAAIDEVAIKSRLARLGLPEIGQDTRNWYFTTGGIVLTKAAARDENSALVYDAVQWAASDGAALEAAKAAKIAELRQGMAAMEAIPYPTSFGFSVRVLPEDMGRWQQLGSYILINHDAYPEGHELRDDGVFDVQASDGAWHELTDAEINPFLSEIGFYYKNQVYGRYSVKEAMAMAATTVEDVEAITF